LFTAVVAAACVPVIGKASFVVETLGFRLGPTLATETLHFLPFDSSLGTLESVQVQIDAVRRHSWALWANGGLPRTLAYEASLTGTVLSVSGADFPLDDLHYGPASTPLLSPVSPTTFATEYAAGRSQFLDGLDPEFPSAFQPGTLESALSEAFAPLAFTGDLILNLDPGDWTVRSAGFFSASLVDVSGTATVAYDYRPAAVPESAIGLFVLGAWLGLVVFARRLGPRQSDR